MPTDTRDLPADVEAVLSQLLAEAAAAAENGEVGSVLDMVDTVGTVTTNKVPESATRDRLLFGCGAVERLLGDADPDDPLAAARGPVAAEYLRRTADRVAE